MWTWALTACEQSVWHKEQRGYKITKLYFFTTSVSVFLLSCQNLTVNIAQLFKHSNYQTQSQRYLENITTPLLNCWQWQIGNCLQNIIINGDWEPSSYQRLWHSIVSLDTGSIELCHPLSVLTEKWELDEKLSKFYQISIFTAPL